MEDGRDSDGASITDSEAVFFKGVFKDFAAKRRFKKYICFKGFFVAEGGDFFLKDFLR